MWCRLIYRHVMMNCYFWELLCLHCVAPLANVSINLLLLLMSYINLVFQVPFLTGTCGVQENQQFLLLRLKLSGNESEKSVFAQLYWMELLTKN